jgi:adenosylcobinamide kinase/adenosylcobinamide-phosphate guanylyltransferase
MIFYVTSFCMMPNVYFVTGGARSGKSSFALQLAAPYLKRLFLATAEPFDEEMQRRISKHREERAEQFTTIEEPLYLDRALKTLPAGTDVVLVDCLTVWTGNLMHYAESRGEAEIETRIECFLDALRHPPCDMIIVSNEVGMGIVPENAMARTFRDIAGIVNQRVASLATEAWLLCSGLPIRLK